MNTAIYVAASVGLLLVSVRHAPQTQSVAVAVYARRGWRTERLYRANVLSAAQTTLHVRCWARALPASTLARARRDVSQPQVSVPQPRLVRWMRSVPRTPTVSKGGAFRGARKVDVLRVRCVRASDAMIPAPKPIHVRWGSYVNQQVSVR